MELCVPSALSNIAGASFSFGQGRTPGKLLVIVRVTDKHDITGIWPTRAGFDRAWYLKLPWYRKGWRIMTDVKAAIRTAFFTTLVTLAAKGAAQLLGVLP